MTLPNALTFLRFLFIPLFVVLLLSPGYQFASGILFVVLSITDLFDGMLARKFKQTSDVGALFDPLADKVLVISALIGLIQLGKVSSIPVMIIVARELMVTGLRVLIAAKKEVKKADLLGKWKTVFQMAATLLLIFNLPFGIEVLWIAVALSVISGAEYYWGARELLGWQKK